MSRGQRQPCGIAGRQGYAQNFRQRRRNLPHIDDAEIPMAGYADAPRKKNAARMSGYSGESRPRADF